MNCRSACSLRNRIQTKRGSPAHCTHAIHTQEMTTGFGPPSVEAVYKELLQLHEHKVGEPRDASKLSSTQGRNALGYLMFLKQKRTGQIKGRGCADGRKQRLHTTKDDASSPTVAMESVLLSCVIDAKEQRDVATVDIPGAFMQGDQDETVHMRLDGTLAELLVKCNPKLYRQYVVTENNKPMFLSN